MWLSPQVHEVKFRIQNSKKGIFYLHDKNVCTTAVRETESNMLRETNELAGKKLIFLIDA